MCSSIKCPYPSHGRFFVLHPPTPGNPSLAAHFASNILTFKIPLPLGIYNDLPWGGYGIFFWNCTMYKNRADHALTKDRDGLRRWGGGGGGGGESVQTNCEHQYLFWYQHKQHNTNCHLFINLFGNIFGMVGQPIFDKLFFFFSEIRWFPFSCS